MRRWADDDETLADQYGDDARDLIEKEYAEDKGEFVDWLIESSYLPEKEMVEGDTWSVILAMLRSDKKVRDAYYDAVFLDKCQEIADRVRDWSEPDYHDERNDRGDW